ncbi:hypothetical protein EST38_g3069, partial [Candolleomyces aberdarensis]
MAAAQFVCWGDKKLGIKKIPARARVAHVLKFEWSPPVGIRSRVTTLEEQKPDDPPNANKKPCFSPMKAKKDAELTPNFWQYAIVRQDILDKYLVYKDRIKIHCEHVPKREDLTVDMYIKTQDGNPDFATLMNGKEKQPAAAAVSSSNSGETTSSLKSSGKSSPPRSPKTPGKIIPPSSKPPGKISPPSSPKRPGKISPPPSPKRPWQDQPASFS